jgi:2-C-methyl-D-erythritol 4-phosphate cytidylyltransferase
MSDVMVVALVPVAGRADQDENTAPLLAAAIRRLAVSVGQIVVLGDVDAPADVATVVPNITVADHAITVARRPDVQVVLVHDPLRAYTPADVVTHVIDEVVRSGLPAIPVLPCSDTVKRVDGTGVVIDTPDRTALRTLQSPIGYPAELIASGAVAAGTVPLRTRTVPGDPRARRLASAVDIAMIDSDR